MGNSLGMEVICFTRRPTPERAEQHNLRFVDLDELMSSADFVQLAVALNDETTGLIGKRELELMKRDAYLINVARAVVVDQSALLDVLANAGIAGYATDVFESEPDYDHPLAKLDNVIVTPHIEWGTPGAAKRTLRIAMDNVLAYLDGRPQNVVES